VLDGVSTTTVEFILEKNISDAVNDVRDAVARVKADMPAELRDPTVTKATTAGRVVLTFTAAAAKPGENRRAGTELVRRQHRRQAPAGGAGVGAVKRVGGVYREIRVELDDAAWPRCACPRWTSRASCARCRRKRRPWRRQRRRAVGAHHRHRADGGRTGAMDLPLPDGRRVRLDQVATVTDTVSEPRAVALQDGKPVIGFEIFRTKGASETGRRQGARAAIAELQGQSRVV
jgi:multidrug efflux pump subunit AcrB